MREEEREGQGDYLKKRRAKFEGRCEYTNPRSSMNLSRINTKRPTVRHVIIRSVKDKE